MTSNETGAPAALRAIEAHELRCRNEKDTAHKCWQERLRLLVVGDDVSERDERLSHTRYLESLELWDDATKKLAVFDKGVTPERRDGVKIPQSEVESMLTQIFRFDRLAFETHLLSIAQDAVRCRDEQDYYAKFAESHRICRMTAIEQGISNEKFPPFVMAALERSL